MTEILLTQEMIDAAFGADPTLVELINPGVISLFSNSTFVQSEKGGWRGDGGYYGPTTAMGRVLGHATLPPQDESPADPTA